MADEDTNEVESYESWTVADLKEELSARGLHTSGNKEELIARLEEDDAAAEDSGEAEGQAETQAEEASVADPWKRVYSPFELPANSAAAQAFFDANPDAVDQSLTLSPDRQAQAEAHIQDHVDAMAAVGVIVEDPRLGPPPTPVLSSLTPDSIVVDTPTPIDVAGTDFRSSSVVVVDGVAQPTVYLSDTSLNYTGEASSEGSQDVEVHTGSAVSNSLTLTVTA